MASYNFLITAKDRTRITTFKKSMISTHKDSIQELKDSENESLLVVVLDSSISIFKLIMCWSMTDTFHAYWISIPFVERIWPPITSLLQLRVEPELPPRRRLWRLHAKSLPLNPIITTDSWILCKSISTHLIRCINLYWDSLYHCMRSAA